MTPETAQHLISFLCALPLILMVAWLPVPVLRAYRAAHDFK